MGDSIPRILAEGNLDDGIRRAYDLAYFYSACVASGCIARDLTGTASIVKAPPRFWRPWSVAKAIKPLWGIIGSGGVEIHSKA